MTDPEGLRGLHPGQPRVGSHSLGLRARVEPPAATLLLEEPLAPPSGHGRFPDAENRSSLCPCDGVGVMRELRCHSPSIRGRSRTAHPCTDPRLAPCRQGAKFRSESFDFVAGGIARSEVCQPVRIAQGTFKKHPKPFVSRALDRIL